MRVLLDTHALLWALDGSENLSELARHTILTLENEVLVSSVSGWEIAIKRALGKLDAPRELAAAIDDAGFVRRLIRFEDCEKLQVLPSHHRDPFDRMLVAQALVDGVPVVTRDPWIARYGVQTIW
jgi:PIN domain nuclease of toxin-antitoxin system